MRSSILLLAGATATLPAPAPATFEALVRRQIDYANLVPTGCVDKCATYVKFASLCDTATSGDMALASECIQICNTANRAEVSACMSCVASVAGLPSDSYEDELSGLCRAGLPYIDDASASASASGSGRVGDDGGVAQSSAINVPVPSGQVAELSTAPPSMPVSAGPAASGTSKPLSVTAISKSASASLGSASASASAVGAVDADATSAAARLGVPALAMGAAMLLAFVL